MESHIMNIPYHQSRYRILGHQVMRSASESLSSECSCNQNSPEYKCLNSEYERVQFEGSDDTQNWSGQSVNETLVNQGISTDGEDERDEDDNMEVIEVPCTEDTEPIYFESEEDTSLVEGQDYIVIYEVDPNNLDEEDEAEDENNNNEERYNDDTSEPLDNISDSEVNENVVQDGLPITQDTPAFSNVDEFLNKFDKDLLEIKNKPVVMNFIKDSIPYPNDDEFLLSHNLDNDEFINPPIKIAEIFEKEEKKSVNIINVEPLNVVLNEDFDTTTNFVDVKKVFPKEAFMKTKNVQRSSSAPLSPSNTNLNNSLTKSYFSLEDLTDLAEISFDNEKYKSFDLTSKNFELQHLTEDDVKSFLISHKLASANTIDETKDNLIPHDMEIEQPVESSINFGEIIIKSDTAQNNMFNRCSTPKFDVLQYCVKKESPTNKNKGNHIKSEFDDFVDVESCNDVVVPVLEANSLNQLLEQFEATEIQNTRRKCPIDKPEKPKSKHDGKSSLVNGTRLQDAGMQLNKNKMRQILMPAAINAVAHRSPSPNRSDHNYCTSKKKKIIPKSGRSLLKPEVLSSNNKVLNTRHRSCKNKKIVYNISSDEESEKSSIKNVKRKKTVNKSDEVTLNTIKQSTVLPTSRKKFFPTHSASNGSVKNLDTSVMNKSACKASDSSKQSNQRYNSSIKLTIKNKSEVILNCDDIRDFHKNKSSEKVSKSSNDIKVSENKSSSIPQCVNEKKSSSILQCGNEKKSNDINSSKNSHNVLTKNNVVENVCVKEEPRPQNNDEHFYTALFSNKCDMQLPGIVKKEKKPFDDEIRELTDITMKMDLEHPQKKRKLNLQEYQRRRAVNSNNSSTTVSPEAIFPDVSNLNKNKLTTTPPNIVQVSNKNTTMVNESEPQRVFDPIREASRKILMNTKKLKTLATIKRDEDIVMSKIPKVQNLELKPLMSDAEVMKIVGGQPQEKQPESVIERTGISANYKEVILVSVGVNTDENIFKKMEISNQADKRAMNTTAHHDDPKSLINFKIRKNDLPVLKQNIFESMKGDKRNHIPGNGDNKKINKDRYRDITATLKSVEKHVDTRISSNSLFASIQDVVMKKAPEESKDRLVSKNSGAENRGVKKPIKTTIVREYDSKLEHGEDKIILHLDRERRKPPCASIDIQTDPLPKTHVHKNKPSTRKRNDSDMSMSSECSEVRSRETHNKTLVKPKESEVRPLKRSRSKELSQARAPPRSKSKDRYDSYRNRSHSRSHRRKRSRSRSWSRSGNHRRYKRSNSPHKRSYQRHTPPDRYTSSSRRSPMRNDYQRSKPTNQRHSKSPMLKKFRPNPDLPSTKKVFTETVTKSLTPPMRKLTISESSHSSSSSSSSSSTSSSSSSSSSSTSNDSALSVGRSVASGASYNRDNFHMKNKAYNAFNSEDRDNTPVEERRIVFVGKLEKEATKMSLRNLFSKYGKVIDVRLHSKEDGSRYGFVTFERARDAWAAVGAAGAHPHYDVGFGGRRAFCRYSYADLDGLEAKYTENAFHGQASLSSSRKSVESFDEMLLDIKKKLSLRKSEQKRQEDKP